MKYVIIGGCIAACGAVEGIRSQDREGLITIIDGEKTGAYTRPLISYYVSDPDRYRNIEYRSRYFWEQNKVIIKEAWAEKIDRINRKVFLDNGEEIEYDRLLLATGASPVIPSISGAAQDWIGTFYTLRDAKKLNRELKPGLKAVIIGSGLIGMKAAEALIKRGADVHIIERESNILPRQLSVRAASLLQKHLQGQGLKITLADEVVSILPDHRINLKSGKQLSADLLLMTAGTVPNTSLARQCNLRVNRGIIVDQELKTSDSLIYAAGDVIESLNMLTGQPEVMALLPHAHLEGYRAGRNMAGGREKIGGSIFINAVKLMGWSICSAGNPEAESSRNLYWQKDEKYVELEIKEGRLLRYIAINIPEITGPLTNAIERKVRVAEEGWQSFLEQGPALSTIPGEYWKSLREVAINAARKRS
jgi:NAD(P)H-nitrite reductase large subunit